MDTKTVRKQLKEKLGYNSRQVSIRNRPGGYSTKLIFTARSPEVDFKKLEEFALSFRDVDVCQYSGEILMGGNTYIDIVIADNLKQTIFDKVKQEVVELIRSTKIQSIGTGEHFLIQDKKIVSFKENDFMFYVYADDQRSYNFSFSESKNFATWLWKKSIITINEA
jgi:hypothetical protein